MPDANYFQEWAQGCRILSQKATDPEVIYQLQAWAMEFDRDADEAEAPAAAREDPSAQQRPD